MYLRGLLSRQMKRLVSVNESFVHCFYRKDGGKEVMPECFHFGIIFCIYETQRIDGNVLRQETLSAGEIHHRCIGFLRRDTFYESNIVSNKKYFDNLSKNN